MSGDENVTVMSGEENVTIMSGEENVTCANGNWVIMTLFFTPLSLVIPYFMVLVLLFRPSSECMAMRLPTGWRKILDALICIIVGSTLLLIIDNFRDLIGQLNEIRYEKVLKLYQEIFIIFAWVYVWSTWRVEWKGRLPKLGELWYEVLNFLCLLLLIVAGFCVDSVKETSYPYFIRLLRSVLSISLLIERIVRIVRRHLLRKRLTNVKPQIEYKSEPAEQSTVKPQIEYKSEPAEHSTVKPQIEYKSDPAEQSTVKPESNSVNLQEKELPILNPSSTKATNKFIHALTYALIRYNTKLVPLNIQEFLKDHTRRTLLICYNDGRLNEDFVTATEDIPVEYRQNIYMIVVKPCRKGHGGNACAKLKLGERKGIAEILDMEYDHDIDREGIYDCQNNNEALQVIIGINDKSDC